VTYSREEMIAALMAGGHMSKPASERPGSDYGEDISIALAEGDSVTVVVGFDLGEDSDSYGEPGDVFVLGPSQFRDNGEVLHSGGHGRGFTLYTPEGQWKANTFAGTIMKLIQSGKFTYEAGPRKPKA
jgi:hypothetical protein